MKYLKNIGIVLLSVALATALRPEAAKANYAFVQSAQNRSGTNSVATAFSSNVTSGNLLVAFIFSENDADTTVTSITDTRGNTYSQAVAPTVVTSRGVISIYYAANTSAGANTVTATVPTGAVNLYIHEYSGIATVSPFDAGTSATGNSSTPSSGNITTTAANDLLVGFTMNGRSTVTATNGFTKRIADVFNQYADTFDGNGATITTYAMTGTMTTGGTWAAAIAGFKIPATGENTPPKMAIVGGQFAINKGQLSI